MALTVAQLTARLTADTSNFFKAMSIADAAMFRTGGIAKRVGAGVGVAFLGGSVMAIRAAGNFEESLNVLQEVSGATGSQFQALSKEAKALGADVRIPNVSAKDAADAMLELAKAGLSVEDVLNGARGVLQLGVSSNLSFADSATTVARSLTAFGLEGSKAGQVADLLTAAANKSTAEVGDMALGFQMASASFHAGGQTVEDLTASLALMANAGIAGSDAGTSLKQMMRRLVPQSEKAKEAMKGLGVEVFTAEGAFKPMREIINEFSKATKNMNQEQREAALGVIFGSDAIRAANIMLTQGTKKFDDMTTAVTAGGEAQAMAEARTKGFNGAVGGLISQIETLAIELGEKMLPAATDVVRGISEFVSNLDPDAIVAFFKPLALVVTGLKNLASILFNLPKSVLAFVGGLAVLKYAILPVIAKVTALATAIKTFSLAAAFAANPVGIVVGAVAGLTLGMKMLTDASRDTIASMEDLTSVFQNSVDATAAYEEAIVSSKEATTAENVAQTALTKVQKEAERVRSDMTKGIISQSDGQKKLEALQKRAKPLEDKLTAAQRTRRQATANLERTQEDANKAQAEGIEVANRTISQARHQIRLGVNVEENKKKISKATRDLNRLTGEEAVALDRANKEAGATAGAYKSNLNPAIADLAKKFQSADGSKLRSELDTVASKAEATASRLSSSGPTIGSGFIGGIKAGILGSAGSLYSSIATLVSGAVAQAKASAKIKSPSQVMRDEVGAKLADGIATGIESGGMNVGQAIYSVMSKATYSGRVSAKAGGSRIGKGYTDATLRAIIMGNEQIKDKMSKGLKAALAKAKSTISNYQNMLQRSFGRMRDRIFRGFDAITNMPTPLEQQLEGQTAAEAQLAKLEADREAAAQKSREDEANTTLSQIAQRIAAAQSLQRGENETQAELAERISEELLQIESDRISAQQALDDIAYERKRAALEAAAEAERKDLESRAAAQRAHYDEERLIQREALEDQLEALENKLMTGKIKAKNANIAILRVLRSFDKGFKNSGKLLGVNFAAGLAATQKKVTKAARAIALAIQRILKLNSPAEEGPLSDLDKWWTPFSDTLLKGVDTRPLATTMTGAVTPPAAATSQRGASVVTVNVSDQTFAGMSRDQADRVARDIKAALDRQVSYTI